jgi:ABC-2 type transport system permease protein
MTMTLTSPAAPARNDLHAIPDVLKSEWIKVSSLRSNKALVAITLAVNVFTAWAVSMWVKDEVLFASRVFVYPSIFTAVLAAIAGVLLFTSEVQHGTLAASLTAQPTRWVIAVSKLVTTTAFGLVLAAVGMVGAFAGSVASGLPLGDTSGIAILAVNGFLFTGLSALIGLGVGMIARHSAAAISGLLVWIFVGEHLLLGILPASASRFLPYEAGFRLLGVGGSADTPAILAAVLPRPQLALIFGTYALIATVVGTVLLYRRDTN